MDGRRRRLCNSSFGANATWQCHVPVRYRKKPLIEAGDYHALHIVTPHLGESRAMLEFVNSEDTNPSHVAHANNSLFLCSPIVNCALGEVYLPYEYQG